MKSAAIYMIDALTKSRERSEQIELANRVQNIKKYIYKRPRLNLNNFVTRSHLGADLGFYYHGKLIKAKAKRKLMIFSYLSCISSGGGVYRTCIVITGEY